MNTYSELLKDPRWQKKRLEIMDRDNFSCQICGCGINDGTPLNVHHILYKEGRNPWEYSGEQLITLCESCHQKVHNKEIILEIPKRKKTKFCAVLYRYFYNKNENYSINESIIYSILVWRSIMVLGWDNNSNKFSVDKIKELLICNSFSIPCVEFSIRGIAKQLGMSELTIRKIILALKDKHIIYENKILCPLELFEGGYISLPIETGLKGLQLVVYAFLKERSKSFHGAIDTWAVKIAEIFNVKKKDIYNMFSVLHKKGFVERLANGNLKIK